MPDFQQLIAQKEYDFLSKNGHLGRRIMLLGLSGSYGYGTNRVGSDVDFRGVALQQPSDILGLTAFEQYVDDQTDTVVYGFNKLVKLMKSFYLRRILYYVLLLSIIKILKTKKDLKKFVFQ